VAYVRGLQDAGVGATVKHFVANESETERMSLDARIDPRTLRELYLAPFEAIVREAGVWAVMAAYNGVNGSPMTESPLLADVLKDEWGFDGVVMSDWFATRSTVPSARAALDLVMPGPDGPWGQKLLEAIAAGEVTAEAVDDKLVRILRLADRVGALSPSQPRPAPHYDEAQTSATLRAAAAAGFVLVRNERQTLPLSAARRVAVIGPNADQARTMGGGSATVFPPYAISPLQGLRAAHGPEVVHGRGVRASERIPVADPPWIDGVQVRLLDAEGRVLHTDHRPGCAFNWLGELGPEVARIEIGTMLRATEPGTYALAASGTGRYALVIAGQTVLDARLELDPGADVVEGLMIPPQAIHELALDADEEVPVTLTHDRDSEMVSFALGLRPPQAGDDEELAKAVALAAESDAAIVVVGTTAEIESEGFDRQSLALPGRQDELVRRVAGANPNTIVVVNAGAPVHLPWADEVAAILLAWFPGQEFGHALADVLLGAVEPGGRLPTTWPRSPAGLPSTIPRDGVLDYEEGLAVGYRSHTRDALYPFGHGLGYTSWEFEQLESDPQNPHHATVRLRNTGHRAGRHVVQVYLSRPDSAIERPPRWLGGFAAVYAQPGETVVATVVLSDRAFAHWDAQADRFAVEPGTFEVRAGSSAAVLPLSTEITISA